MSTISERFDREEAKTKTLKKYTATDSFHHCVVVVAFDSVTALQEAKKALSGDVISLIML